MIRCVHVGVPPRGAIAELRIKERLARKGDEERSKVAARERDRVAFCFCAFLVVATVGRHCGCTHSDILDLASALKTASTAGLVVQGMACFYFSYLLNIPLLALQFVQQKMTGEHSDPWILNPALLIVDVTLVQLASLIAWASGNRWLEAKLQGDRVLFRCAHKLPLQAIGVW